MNNTHEHLMACLARWLLQQKPSWRHAFIKNWKHGRKKSHGRSAMQPKDPELVAELERHIREQEEAKLNARDSSKLARDKALELLSS